MLVLLMMFAGLSLACGFSVPVTITLQGETPDPTAFDRTLDAAFAHVEKYPSRPKGPEWEAWQDDWSDIIFDLFVANQGNMEIDACMAPMLTTDDVDACKAELQAYR